jgi:hypothetical protein
MGLDHRRLLPAYLLGAYTVLVAAFASLPMIETAAVKVTIPAQRVEANVTLNGALDTATIDASVSESQQGTSTAIPVPPTWASGSVVFFCSPACTIKVHVPSHQYVSTKGGQAYETLATIDVNPGAQVPVAVFSVDPGTTGNTPANSVVVIGGSGIFPSAGQYPTQFHVNNPQAITGGAGATTMQVVQQSDLDAVQTALTAKITQDLDAALRAKAAGLTILPVGPPTLNVSSDHRAGDRSPKFTVTISASVSAIAFADSSAQALLRAALQQQVPTGYQLTADPLQWTYLVQPVGGGSARLDGTISGFVAPKLSPAALGSQITGATPQEARARLQRDAPGSQVDIHVTPAASPWLPIIADHINFTLIVVTPPI